MVINVPKLKTHALTVLTAGIKNTLDSLTSLCWGNKL
ncbi:MAG: DUF362 domain-containing protein [Desulfovermiculus sp.]|nr:DUF362 domain-containing protein [Desulfovermiculus sp.]